MVAAETIGWVALAIPVLGILPLLTARIAARILLHEGTAEAADLDHVSKTRPVLIFTPGPGGAVREKSSDLALAASKKLEHEVSPVTVVLASAIASAGPHSPKDKIEYAKSLLAHAQLAGKRVYAYLTPDGELGPAGGKRPTSTATPPTYEDLVIAERVLEGQV